MSAYNKKTWKNTIAEYPTRRVLHNVETDAEEIVTVTRSIGTVTQEGDVFDAPTMNDLEDRIAEPWAGCWIAFEDENGNPTTEPYFHWMAEE